MFNLWYWGIRLIFTIRVPAPGNCTTSWNKHSPNSYRITKHFFSLLMHRKHIHSIIMIMMMVADAFKYGYQFFDTSHSDMGSMSPPLNLRRLCMTALMDAAWWKGHCVALEGRPSMATPLGLPEPPPDIPSRSPAATLWETWATWRSHRKHSSYQAQPSPGARQVSEKPSRWAQSLAVWVITSCSIFPAEVIDIMELRQDSPVVFLTHKNLWP